MSAAYATAVAGGLLLAAAYAGLLEKAGREIEVPSIVAGLAPLGVALILGSAVLAVIA